MDSHLRSGTARSFNVIRPGHFRVALGAAIWQSASRNQENF